MIESKQPEILISLDLQYFAEPGEPEPGEPEPGTPEPTPGEEKKFSQAELDQIIKDRLDREKAKRQKELDDLAAEAERKRLEEQNEYKTLYDQAQAELARVQAETAATKLEADKKEMILKAGYDVDQLDDISTLVTGGTIEEITASFERVQKLVPVKPTVVDPQLQGSQRQAPKTKDSYEAARERARSLLLRK